MACLAIRLQFQFNWDVGRRPAALRILGLGCVVIGLLLFNRDVGWRLAVQSFLDLHFNRDVPRIRGSGLVVALQLQFNRDVGRRPAVPRILGWGYLVVGWRLHCLVLVLVAGLMTSDFNCDVPVGQPSRVCAAPGCSRDGSLPF